MPVGPPSLRVQLFGDAGVQGASGEIPLTPLQLALVTLVYGHGPEGLSRPSAARLLWGADDPGKWRQRIRQHLHDIRTRVGWPIIATPGDTLRPAPEVSCDLHAFESALQSGSLQDAAAFIGRGFIPTPFEITEPYNDWRMGRAARLLREVRTRAFARWSQAFERGDWVEVRDAAEALYTLHPGDPQAVERVVEARGRVGQHSSAEAAFTKYLASVALDSEPSGSVVDAMERVRALERADLVAAEPDGSRIPLVGRRCELNMARAPQGFARVRPYGGSLLAAGWLDARLHGVLGPRGADCAAHGPAPLRASLPTPGTCLRRGTRGRRRAPGARRHEEIWGRAHDVGPAIWSILSKAHASGRRRSAVG